MQQKKQLLKTKAEHLESSQAKPQGVRSHILFVNKVGQQQLCQYKVLKIINGPHHINEAGLKNCKG